LKKKSVIWTQKASISLDRFCAYIERDSLSAAKRVKKEIIKTAGELNLNSEIYQLDEFFANESQNIRRFFRWSYRVVYLVNEKQVVILDVFHTASQTE
jgi:plasmid stabilization system protein ParE